MPISATGNRLQRIETGREAGFSLVELLTVLAILSLMVGAVVLNLPEGTRDFDVQSEAIHVQAQAFLDEGARQGEIRALGLDQNGLVLFRHDGLDWQAEQRLVWPEAARITHVTGDKRERPPDEAAPDFLFEPFGLASDMQIHLDGSEISYALVATDEGRLELRAQP